MGTTPATHLPAVRRALRLRVCGVLARGVVPGDYRGGERMTDLTRTTTNRTDLMLLIGQGRRYTLMPQTLEEAMRLAALLAESSIVPQNFRGKAGDVLVAILQGMDVGLSPIRAVQSVAVINGKPSIYGDAALGVVMASGALEDIAEEYVNPGSGAKADEVYAVCRVTRKGGRVTEHRFSWADAVRAGLSGKELYKTYPQRMLQMRARAWALRDGFADVLSGLQVREEVEDYSPGPLTTDEDLMPRRKSLADELVGDAGRNAGGTIPDAEAGATTPVAPADHTPTAPEPRSLADALVGALAATQEARSQPASPADQPSLADELADVDRRLSEQEDAHERQIAGLLQTFEQACVARGVGAKQIASWWAKCAPGKGPDTCTEVEAMALLREVEALPIRTRVTINGKAYFTMGCTAEQLLQAFTLSAAVDAKAGKQMAADLLLKEFGLKTRVDLTQEMAERYLIRLREIAEG